MTDKQDKKGEVSITPDHDISRPITFMPDANDVIPHDEVPAEIRDSIISQYGIEFFQSREWTKAKIVRLERIIRGQRYGSNNVTVQICSDKCPFDDVCPYCVIGEAPTGERCPIELRKSNLLYDEYLKSVSDRLKLAPEEIRDDVILHNLIMGLVESDMVEDRLNGMIALDGLTTEVVAAINEESGEVYYKEEESVSIRIKERVSRRKDQLYRQLLATPEMAEKYKRTEKEDPVSKGLKVIDEIEKLLAAKARHQIVEADIDQED